MVSKYNPDKKKLEEIRRQIIAEDPSYQAMQRVGKMMILLLVSCILITILMLVSSVLFLGIIYQYIIY